MHIKTSLPALSLLALGIAFAVQGADRSGSSPSAAAKLAASDDRAVTAVGRAVTIDVAANDGNIGAIQALHLQQKARNGRASVVNGMIVYVPEAGFTGRDTFRYQVRGANGDARGRVTVDVGEALVLSGKVTDGPIANATVNASVDGHAFTAQADANGDYSLEVIGTTGGMVTMGAQGSAAQPAVNFLSVVGDFDRLQTEAGADGELTRDENNQVQVTNVSTAQAFLMQQANAGAPVTDDVQLVAARESLDNGQLLVQAAAIMLVVDGGYTLPAGVTNTLDLISNPAALAGFIGTVNADDPAALGNAMAEIASDTDLTVPTAVEQVPGEYNLVYHLGIPGAVSAGYIQGNRVELEEDGTGNFLRQSPNANPAVTWTFDQGRIIVVPVAPVTITAYEVIPGTGQVRTLVTATRYEFTRLFDGDGRDTMAVKTIENFSYPDNPGIPGGTRTLTGSNLAISDEGGIAPYVAADIVGSRSLWIAGTPYANANFTGSELFTFAANGTGQRADGPTFTWSVDSLGRLVTAYANGDQARYSRLNNDGRKGEGVAGEWLSNSGMRSSTFMLSALADGSSFNAGNAQASWRSGFYMSRAEYNPASTDFFVVLDPSQIGWAISYDSTQGYPIPLGWTTNGGAMDATQYRNGANQPVHFCTVGVNGCYIYLLRRWRPVATDGNRRYVIEEFLYDADLDGDLDVTNQRANYYDASPRPPFAVTPPVSVSSKQTVKQTVRQAGKR